MIVDRNGNIHMTGAEAIQWSQQNLAPAVSAAKVWQEGREHGYKNGVADTIMYTGAAIGAVALVILATKD